jgi:predicted P-loop ATPase
MDYCLVLKGGQGLLKSTSLKALAGGEWFTSSHARDDKDFLLNVHSCWIYELAELETITNKTQSGALKNLITTATDTFRTPYGRTSEKHHRQSVFCATVNKEEFLRDDTGNRRFWVVPIEGANKLDREAITAARDAIWKAAVLAHEAGELPMLTKEMEALSALQNEQFNEQDPWVGLVQAWMDNDPILRWKGEAGDPSTSKYDPGDQYSSAEILYSAGLRQANQFGKPDEMRLAEVLRSLGWHRTKQRRVNGKVTRLWQMSQPSQPSQPHVEQVVTPQTEMAAVVLGVASQPSQPLETKGLTAAEHCVKELPDASAPLLDDRGCDTPSKPRRTTAAQSVSVSQPLLSEVVTAAKVVTVEGAITDIEIGAAIEHHGSGGWRGGWRVTAAEQTNIGIRYRIESGSASLNVGADVIRLCA